MYRDADNYKQDITIVFSGLITDEQIAAIKAKMEDGYFIIAEQLGLPSPSQLMADQYDFPSESDHVWTTVTAFEDETPTAASLHTSQPADSPQFSVEALVSAFENLAAWDVAKEMDRLGLHA